MATNNSTKHSPPGMWIRIALALLGWGLPLLAGCSAPPSTLELVSVAQKALADAATYQTGRHEQALRDLDNLQSSLDAAFDADVRLAEAGRISDAQGQEAPLSAEWVISARKGYAAARDQIAQQRTSSQSAHEKQLDNLSAAAEALDLAKALIIQSSSLSQQVKQTLMTLQRRTLP